jgi:hypothetical protein
MAIGFDLEATGSNGYRRSSGAWSEGSLISLKIIMSVPKANPPGMGGTRRGILGSIEASFSKIAKNLLSRVCSMGVDFTLFMKGDIKFKYVFESGKSADQVESEFLNLLANASDGGVGDQVMIHICRTIEEFMTLNISNLNDDLVLTIDLDL